MIKKELNERYVILGRILQEFIFESRMSDIFENNIMISINFLMWF